jgi:hypothetical protein
MNMQIGGESKNTAWLVLTKQLWKLHVSILLLIAASALYVYLNVAKVELPYAESLILAFLAMSICWFSISIYCKNCGHGVIYRMLKKESAGGFVNCLLHSKVCPACGYEDKK